MKFRFTWIIFLLIAFVPFEVLFLKYLPVSDAIYGYLRFAVEIIIYLLGGLLLVRFIQLKKIPAGTSIDKLLLLFVVYAIVITVVNNALFPIIHGIADIIKIYSTILCVGNYSAG
ncbi:MAG: hypothetical protein IPG39_14320 [Bacteroidetes bacterium]|nr:hypothetical protein [Bacteroidota bacterium]